MLGYGVWSSHNDASKTEPLLTKHDSPLHQKHAEILGQFDVHPPLTVIFKSAASSPSSFGGSCSFMQQLTNKNDRNKGI